MLNPFQSRKSKHPPVPYTTEAAFSFVFEPSSRQKELAAASRPRAMLYSPPRPGDVRLNRSLRLAGYLPGVGPLHIDLRNASLEVIGHPSAECLIETHTQADAPTRAKAARLLEQVAIELKDSRVRFENARLRKHERCQSSLTAIIHPRRPLIVRGKYSAVYLAELSEGAEVHTTHARIKILNVGPRVRARVDEGIIDYAGQEGSVSLVATWSIHLKFLSPIFAGALEASTEGVIRVLVPSGFKTSFEANVSEEALFVCRADMQSQIRRRARFGRFIYSFGGERPVIRLTARNGPIVIDEDVAQAT